MYPLLSSQVALSHCEWTVVTKPVPRNALPYVAGSQACTEPPAFSLHEGENHAEVPAIEEDRRDQILEQGSVAFPEDHASIGLLRQIGFEAKGDSRAGERSIQARVVWAT